MNTLQTLLRLVQKSKPMLSLVVAVGGFSLAALVYATRLLDVAELKSLDFRFLNAYRPDKADTSVVLIAIDQNSLDFFQKQEIRWPWPREFYGTLVRYLSKAGAKTIAFDIDFSQPDIDRLNADAKESDAAFADAMKQSANVVLVAHLSNSDGGLNGNPIEARHLLSVSTVGGNMPTFERATAPMPAFQDAARRLGVVNFENDKDGIARRAPLLYKLGAGHLPYFGLAGLMTARDISNTSIDSLLKTIPLSKSGDFLLYWYGKGGPDGAFKYYSIASLIVSAAKLEQGETPDVPLDAFRGKHVIIGASAAGLLDFKPTPFTELEPYPGMEIHATMMSNLLNEHYLRETPEWATYLISLLLALMTSFVFFRVNQIGVSVSAVVVLAAGYFGVATLVFYNAKVWMPMVMPELALSLSFALAAVVSYATEGSQKRELRKVFNRYLNARVIDSIVENPDVVELGGQEVEATVFFSDIEGFTDISEKLSPKDLVLFLNEYFTIASRVILDREAMVDKYIGDAIMAVFGAPIAKDLHAASACLAALDVQRKLTAFYQQKSADLPHFQTRIGLNTGKMVVGNIGSEMHMDYTVIGDAVNLASRLEGVNKEYGTRILISETTYQLAKEIVEVRELDNLRVKGKEIPIRIYELICEKGELAKDQEEKLKLFAEGLALYRKREWKKAIKVFEDVKKLDPNDGPAQTYIKRCYILSEENLPDSWDGVYVMKTK